MKQEKKLSVAWECSGCGKRHLWKWAPSEICSGHIVMLCSERKCQQGTRGELVQIGRDAYALAK